MSSLTEVDQATKDAGITSRVRVALRRWAIAELVASPQNEAHIGVAKAVLRGNEAATRTLVSTMMSHPGFDTTALADNAEGDESLQEQVDMFVPAMISLGVLVIADPEGN